jgi:hypothetical protein
MDPPQPSTDPPRPSRAAPTDVRLARRYFLNQHVEAKHKPKAVKDREIREKAALDRTMDRGKAAADLGAKGAAVMAAFFSRSQAVGAADKEVRR